MDVLIVNGIIPLDESDHGHLVGKQRRDARMAKITVRKINAGCECFQVLDRGVPMRLPRCLMGRGKGCRGNVLGKGHHLLRKLYQPGILFREENVRIHASLAKTTTRCSAKMFTPLSCQAAEPTITR